MAKIGKYEVVRKLATGGMAEVFLAKAEWAHGVERNVVVKRILTHLVEEPSFVAMFLSEAKLTSQLNHPNIVQIFEFGEDEGVYYLAMEYVDGPTVRALATRASELGKRIPFRVCAKIISSACEALAYAHDLIDSETGVPLQIVHRDISPDNILISRHGAVKVVDFGIAKAITQSHRTTTGIVKGKVAYMAPEQLRSTKSIDRRADVYALGVVLYELVSSTKPYDADSEISMAHAVLYEPIIPIRERRQDVPEELEKIITKALAHEREERYADCREMYTDLERYVLGVSREPLGAFQIAQMLVDLEVVPQAGPQITLPPGMATPNRAASALQTPSPSRYEEARHGVERPADPERLAMTGKDASGDDRHAGRRALLSNASDQPRQSEAERTQVECPKEITPSLPATVLGPAPVPASDQPPAAEASPRDRKEPRLPPKAPPPPREDAKESNWRVPALVACALLISGVAFVGGLYWSQLRAAKAVDLAKKEQVQQEQVKKAEESRQAEEARNAEQTKKAEEPRKADVGKTEEARKAEQVRLARHEEQAKLLAKPISLTVESEPKGTTIRLTQGDKLVMEKPSPVELTLPPGIVKIEVLDQIRHLCKTELVVLKPGGDPVKRTVVANISNLTILESFGSFSLSVVTVDGSNRGRAPVQVMVCEGAHTIDFACNNGKKVVRQVTTKAGAPERVMVECR